MGRRVNYDQKSILRELYDENNRYVLKDNDFLTYFRIPLNNINHFILRINS